MCTEIMYENVHYSNTCKRKTFRKPIMFLGIKTDNPAFSCRDSIASHERKE